jgi:hypothetical protein
VTRNPARKSTLGLHRLDDIVAMWLAMSALSTATKRPVSSKGDSG